MPQPKPPKSEPGRGSAERPTASVVVPAWNFERREELAVCAAAIAAQSDPPLETIVVCDHNPELAAWAREALPATRVVENRHERGVVGNRNSGGEAASGEVIVFTDDDTRADADWLRWLLAPFSDPTVVAVGGALEPNFAGPEPQWLPTEFFWIFGCSYTGLPTTVAPIRNPIAANMAIRREAFERLGGFRIGVPPRALSHRGKVLAGGHALEDTDLGIRLRRAYPEGQILYQPAALVHHNVDRGQATLSYLLRRSFEEGEGKAVLAENVGEEGLESERRHLFVTVPLGFLRGFRQLLGGDRHGPARSLALVAGIGAAGAGYLVARLRGRSGPDPSPEHA